MTEFLLQNTPINLLYHKWSELKVWDATFPKPYTLSNFEIRHDITSGRLRSSHCMNHKMPVFCSNSVLHSHFMVTRSEACHLPRVTSRLISKLEWRTWCQNINQSKWCYNKASIAQKIKKSKITVHFAYDRYACLTHVFLNWNWCCEVDIVWLITLLEDKLVLNIFCEHNFVHNCLSLLISFSLYMKKILFVD